tara:strand:+ start:293 stop:1030 length:738 start_codon:yes stop_codon:yes gene_type:complete
MNRLKLAGLFTFTALSLSLAATSPALAQDYDSNEKLKNYNDGAYVMLSGQAYDIDDDEFTLRHSGGMIEVELDDWDFPEELANYIMEGEKVTVSGTVEDSLFSDREVEANNIYVDRTYTYYYVKDMYPAYSGRDAQMQNRTAHYDSFEEGTYISARGTVRNVSEDQFTMQSRGQTIKVDISELEYEPFEDGLLAQGDRVYVSGEVEEALYDDRIIDADLVVASYRMEESPDMDEDGYNKRHNINR